MRRIEAACTRDAVLEFQQLRYLSAHCCKLQSNLWGAIRACKLPFMGYGLSSMKSAYIEEQLTVMARAMRQKRERDAICSSLR